LGPRNERKDYRAAIQPPGIVHVAYFNISEGKMQVKFEGGGGGVGRNAMSPMNTILVDTTIWVDFFG
jgi:hypothetical protein